ncbi:hypothetical protein P7K49_028317 [Saguinus oedipus]|uniref:Uncharacterized protein n=1 Tax=Saguinus oedipus TaxID=9490 RepID=A0ABQ9UBX4_SAGOE|nr:hypothetical protein P7K49_028317 [Saguinus oedipus]
MRSQSLGISRNILADFASVDQGFAHAKLSEAGCALSPSPANILDMCLTRHERSGQLRMGFCFILLESEGGGNGEVSVGKGIESGYLEGPISWLSYDCTWHQTPPYQSQR